MTKWDNRTNREIGRDSVERIHYKIWTVAAYKTAAVVNRLPKTRAGKILRATMVKIADSEAFKLPATIDDPVILDEIKAALQALGYAQ